MNDTVQDRSGVSFDIQRRGAGHHSAPFGGRSFRAVLTQADNTRSILDNDDNRSTLARAMADVGRIDRSEVDTITMAELRPHVEAALARGSISFVTRQRRFRPLCDIDAVEPAETLTEGMEEEEVRATHTLEIELVDEDDEPVASEPYRVELPNGDVVNGRLNAQGKAMLTGIVDSGNCKVTFPNLDEATWGPG